MGFGAGRVISQTEIAADFFPAASAARGGPAAGRSSAASIAATASAYGTGVEAEPDSRTKVVESPRKIHRKPLAVRRRVEHFAWLASVMISPSRGRLCVFCVLISEVYPSRFQAANFSNGGRVRFRCAFPQPWPIQPVRQQPEWQRPRNIPRSTLDLIQSSTVIDMLGLLTLDYKKLSSWEAAPERFQSVDYQRLKDSGITIFHPAVGFTGADVYKSSLADITGLNLFIAGHADKFLRVDRAADLSHAKRQGKIHGILHRPAELGAFPNC